ncbi:MAG TPA: radical SAM family heme chaperone HemW [Deltaproteobacteria bacterium]|nr:radical SAM family heme chaperone HemW [Deltaproteobacteria bacterium]
MATKAVPGLYIHIPFCRVRCAYCDFCSTTDIALITDYLHALSKEIELYRDDFPTFDTVYLGGGTPSLLSLNQIEAIMEKIHNVFSIQHSSEITIEVNPADLDLVDLERLRGLGINRINIGVQSLEERELILLGRRHNSCLALVAIEEALKAGFENIGIDLIYGLPGQRLSRWHNTLAKAISLNPSHLSCYELELKPGTPLGRKCLTRELPVHSQEILRDFFMSTSEILEDSGYVHYEISNFAKGMEKASRHNQKYWDHTPYLGLGPSAHSFKANNRWWNHESLAEYIQDLRDNKHPVSASETLGLGELLMEAWFLGLRTKRGIDLDVFQQRYGCDLMKEKGPALIDLAKAGLIIIESGSVRPTRSGMAVCDALALI